MTHTLSTLISPPRIVFSAEGIELVVGCWQGGTVGVPPNLLALGGECQPGQSGCYWLADPDMINYAVYYRPSSLSSPGPVAIDEWWGTNYNERPGYYMGTANGAYQLSTNQWLLVEGTFESWTGGTLVGGL